MDSLKSPRMELSILHDIRLEACTNRFKRKLKTFLFERYYC